MWLEIHERAVEGETDLTLTLPFEARQRSRLRVTLSSGEEAALLLPRGSVLRGGDLLRASDGRLVRIKAAPETVSTVRSQHTRSLARVAYHLGNRHVALEVGDDYVRYLHDHVLDDMVHELGLHAEREQAPFEPEAGAYGRSSHDHPHALRNSGHGHAHERGRAHEHGHDHAYGRAHPHRSDAQESGPQHAPVRHAHAPAEEEHDGN